MQEDMSSNRFERISKMESEDTKNPFKSGKKKYETNKASRWSSLQMDESPKNTFKDRKTSEFKRRSSPRRYSKFRSPMVEKATKTTRI